MSDCSVSLLVSGYLLCMSGTVLISLFTSAHICSVVRDSSVGITTRYGLDLPGMESRWWVRFSVPVQTGPAAHPPPCIRAYRLTYLGVKLSRRVVDHTVPSSAEVTPPPRLHVMLQVDISLSALVSLSVYFKWPSHYFWSVMVFLRLFLS